MKNRFSVGADANGWGLFSAVIMILTGGIGTVFFGLALIGVAVSPNIVGNLLPALVTVMFFIGSVWLLRRGIRGLKQHKNDKAWEKSAKVSTQKEELWETVQPSGGKTEQEQAVKCESCGAVGTADKNGCCEYCGTVFAPRAGAGGFDL